MTNSDTFRTEPAVSRSRPLAMTLLSRITRFSQPPEPEYQQNQPFPLPLSGLNDTQAYNDTPIASTTLQPFPLPLPGLNDTQAYNDTSIASTTLQPFPLPLLGLYDTHAYNDTPVATTTLQPFPLPLAGLNDTQAKAYNATHIATTTLQPFPLPGLNYFTSPIALQIAATESSKLFLLSTHFVKIRRARSLFESPLHASLHVISELPLFGTLCSFPFDAHVIYFTIAIRPPRNPAGAFKPSSTDTSLQSPCQASPQLVPVNQCNWSTRRLSFCNECVYCRYGVRGNPGEQIQKHNTGYSSLEVLLLPHRYLGHIPFISK
jgi:hypothetical protein